jgi:hypothetical protein
MSVPEGRLATNEAFFREVNERISETAIQLGGEERYEFLCECVSTDCNERIELSIEEYEYVRQSPTRFIVLPGHHVGGVEQLAERVNGYQLVEKTGEAAAVAAALDPRRR